VVAAAVASTCPPKLKFPSSLPPPTGRRLLQIEDGGRRRKREGGGRKGWSVLLVVNKYNL